MDSDYDTNGESVLLVRLTVQDAVERIPAELRPLIEGALEQLRSRERLSERQLARELGLAQTTARKKFAEALLHMRSALECPDVEDYFETCR